MEGIARIRFARGVRGGLAAVPALLLAALLPFACGPSKAPPDAIPAKPRVVVHAEPPGTPRPVPPAPVTPPTTVVPQPASPAPAPLPLKPPQPAPSAPAPTLAAVPPGPDAVEPDPLPPGTLPDFAAVYERVVPSVVKIKTWRRSGGPRSGEQPLGLGTGFFYGEAGEILTNAHVLADAQRIEVETADGQVMDATLIGEETLTDLALLKVEMAEPPPPLVTAPAASLRPGMWVLVIGNPLGLEFSASKGIVSALNRTDVAWDRVGYWDFIQTDAAINPGNSGGPLVDRHGRLVGVATLVDRDANRIGFAIPLTTALVVAEHLRRYGKLRRAELGIQILERGGRLEVVGVYPDSPAHLAGFKPGDIIVSLDGEPPEGVPQLRWRIAIHPLDQVAEFEIERGAERKHLSVPLQAAPDAPAGR